MISISNEVLHLKAYTNLFYKYMGPAANQNTNYKKNSQQPINKREKSL